jgi:hypothetical protein
MKTSSNTSRERLFLEKIPYESGAKATLNADHYFISNERRIELFEPYLKDLGGGYIGVGSDQNLSLAAWAKSEYIWLMDFDDYVVSLNRIHILFLKECDNYNCFLDKWKRENKESSLKLVEQAFSQEKDFDIYKKVYTLAIDKNYGVMSRLKELSFMSENFGFKSFHNRKDDYDYLRNLALMERIRADRGDLTKKGTMQVIASKAKEMQIPIRVIYTSNAEEYFRFPDEYRDNILSLPSDNKGYMVRTFTTGAKHTLGFPEGEKYPKEFPFHYNLQKIENMKKWMAFRSFISPLGIVEGRTKVSQGFSIQESTPESLNLKESGETNKKPKSK